MDTMVVSETLKNRDLINGARSNGFCRMPDAENGLYV